MKRTNTGIKILWLAVLVAAVFSLTATAESVSNRDLSVDDILIKNLGASGMLPATAGQAVGSPVGVLPPTGTLGGAGKEVAKITLEGIKGNGLKDGKANIYDFSGGVKVKSIKIGEWQDATIGMLLQKGDEILTQAGSHASVTYDARYLNVTYIPENTKAEIRSIEPTDIFLMDGKIFNILDGLPRGSKWKVSTPVAVSAVRGTWYLVHYVTASGEFLTATFNVPDDGEQSKVEVMELKEGKKGSSVLIPEGNQILLKEGQSPAASLITDIDPKWLQQIIDFLEKLGEYRALHNGQLPPTGSEFFDVGVGNGRGNELDPQLDTGGVGDDPPSSEDSDLTSYLPPNEDDIGPGDCEFEDCFDRKYLSKR